MLNDITLGQYFPIASPLHRLDPRTKILGLMFHIFAIFMSGGWVSYGLTTAFTAWLVVLSRVPLKMYFKGLKPIVFVIIFTAILNMFLTKGTQIYVYGTNTHITYEGIILAIKMVMRLVLLIVSSSVLTYTTSPIQLTDGIESLLKPAAKLRFPTHELAMMMSIAIRFIPTLIEETEKIVKAQKARGSDIDAKSLIKKVKALTPMLVPLFISAFRRADDLAVAMESRCYSSGVSRTRMKQIHYTRTDLAAALIFALFFVLLITIKFFGV